MLTSLLPIIAMRITYKAKGPSIIQLLKTKLRISFGWFQISGYEINANRVLLERIQTDLTFLLIQVLLRVVLLHESTNN